VRCVCGRSKDVPPLREMRQLSPAQAPRREQRAWTPRQGALFGIGGIIAVAGFAVAAFLGSRYMRLDTREQKIDEIDPVALRQDALENWDVEDTWKNWKRLSDLDEQPLQRPFVIYYQERRKMANKYLIGMLATGGVGLAGLAVAGSAFFVRQRSGEGP